MTLHLRAIHCAENVRADVRAQRFVTEGTTEQLRDETAERRPLRWPLPINLNSTNRGD